LALVRDIMLNNVLSWEVGRMEKTTVVKTTVCGIVILLAMAAPSLADTHYVSPGQSIQTTINAATNGDHIEVAPGTYNEAINFNGKSVHLYSSGGPGTTTINGNGADHVVKCVTNETANTIIEGFTITGG
jgi:serine protease